MLQTLLKTDEEKKGGGHRYLDTWIPKICQVSKKKYPRVSTSIQKYKFLFLFLSINLIH